MIYLRRVEGHSMLPRLKPGQFCLFVFAWRFRVGDVVLVKHGGTEFVKRIQAIRGQNVDLAGDNLYDSLDLPNMPKRSLIARMVWPNS